MSQGGNLLPLSQIAEASVIEEQQKMKMMKGSSSPMEGVEPSLTEEEIKEYRQKQIYKEWYGSPQYQQAMAYLESRPFHGYASSAPWTFPNNDPPGVVDGFKYPPMKTLKVNRDPFATPASQTVSEISLGYSSVFEKSNSGMKSSAPPSSSEAVVIPKTEEVEQQDSSSSPSSKSGFNIHVSALDGDCLFDSIRMAIASAGSPATIQNLRDAVAGLVLNPDNKKATETMTTWRDILRDALKNKEDASKNEDPKKREKEEKEADLLIREFGHARCLLDAATPFSQETRLKLYRVMRSKEYWGEWFALGVLERLLNIKFLIVDGDTSQAQGGEDHGEKFDPNWFCILLLQGIHYQPVSAASQTDGKEKFLFKYEEIPEMVKTKFVHDQPKAKRWYINLDLSQKTNLSALQKSRKNPPSPVKKQQ